MDAKERKTTVRRHAMELEREIRWLHMPRVITGRDIHFDDFIVIGREIDDGRYDDGQRFVIHIKIEGAPGEWKYDLEYRRASARLPTDKVIRDRTRDQTMEAVSDFLKVAAAA